MLDADATADLSLGANEDLNTTDNGLSPEEKKKQDEALALELEETEKEITTLKQVLNAKIKRANDIKRKLGISVWSEMRDTAKTSITDLKSTNAFKTTVQAAQVAKEKTSGALTTAKEKISTVTTSTTFKSFGEKFGSAYSSVKDKLKLGTAGAEASSDGSEQSTGPSTLEEAISADKQNKFPAGGASVTLSAPDSGAKM